MEKGQNETTRYPMDYNANEKPEYNTHYKMLTAPLIRDKEKKPKNPLLATVENVSYMDNDEYMMLLARAALLRILTMTWDYTQVADTEHATIVFHTQNIKRIMEHGIPYDVNQSRPISENVIRFIVNEMSSDAKLYPYPNGKIISEKIGSIMGYVITDVRQKKLTFQEVINLDITGFLFNFKNETHRSLDIYRNFAVVPKSELSKHLMDRWNIKIPDGYDEAVEYAMEFVNDYRRFTSEDLMAITKFQHLDFFRIIAGILNACNCDFNLEVLQEAWDTCSPTSPDGVIIAQRDFHEFMTLVRNHPKYIIPKFANMFNSFIHGAIFDDKELWYVNGVILFDAVYRFLIITFRSSVYIMESLTHERESGLNLLKDAADELEREETKSEVRRSE